ncbi:MAG TPA: acyl carrier protein [Bacteroidales bacterium]|jgi:acyl carrier protein|nr:acyl carrier protein [Bacteroidales bacterium]
MNQIDTTTVTDRIRAYVMEETYAENGKINNDTLVFKEGFFDSMGFIRLITFLENEFRIKISDDDLVEKNFESINSMSDFVQSRLN